MDPAVAPGQLLGNGTGRVEGPHLNGDLRWSFFEEDRAWDPGILGAEPSMPGQLGRSVCRTYPRGIIETEDGARIQFEAQGFALGRKDDPTWRVASTVWFVTDDDGYRWITDDLVNYQGTFDGRTGTAIWSFRAPEEMIPSGTT